MTREEKTKWAREFYFTLAVELESHLANGSEFIYSHGWKDESVVDLREFILKKEVARLRRLGSAK